MVKNSNVFRSKAKIVVYIHFIYFSWSSHEGTMGTVMFARRTMGHSHEGGYNHAADRKVSEVISPTRTGHAADRQPVPGIRTEESEVGVLEVL